ncbi:MAG: alpha/beta fold hydrolase [Betaproteobacteria bacterium]|nr:alpha/beta fold hydrolase [Betaproteobacteria bacterium]
MEDRLFSRETPLALADQGAFFVGGEYIASGSGRVHGGHMFVQYQIPAQQTQPYPVVMIHGGGQTGVNFLCTPDGRRGWADYFVANGYAVYVVDQPSRGRSGLIREVYGETVHRGAEAIADRFTAPERVNLWPQAQLHTQWPGSGVAGDAAFDQFYCSQVESATDQGAGEVMMRAAGSALLDRVGPAILITHSQSGPMGWTLADARPKLVKGIVSVEPNGPPLYEATFKGAPDWFEDDFVARPWGITRHALQFDPPVKEAGELKFVKQEKPDAPGLMRCWLQAEPVRRLVNLQGIPILIVTGEASYHAPYDHSTSKFLKQAGVDHTYVRLADVGIRGNGHMVMLEKNNLEIARYFDQWLRTNVK